MAAALPAGRPLMRSECRTMPRPCPYVTCRNHLVVVANGSSLVHIGKRNDGSKTLAASASGARVEEWSNDAMALLEGAKETCAIDVAESGGLRFQEIADLIGITKQRVEQIYSRAIKKLSAQGLDGLSRNMSRVHLMPEKLHPSIEHIAKYFAYEHLPERLQVISKRFADLAENIVETSPNSPETTVALRKLLESKDAAVRAAL